MHTIDRYPEDFYAYIGVGQVVDMEQNEKLSYDYCLQEAYKQANTTAVRELQTLGPPRKGAYRTGLEGLLLQRKWLTNLGGSLHGKSDLYGVLQHVLTAYEYSAGDLLGYAQGALFSLERLWPQILTVDLFRQVPAVTVPVFFCAGRNDYQTPAVLVKQYYHQLQAPHKELIWFEQSAHSPLFEEPEKFNVLLIDRILPQTLGSTHYSKNRRAYQLTGEK
jgi:pimeloyl-ACP methyl ester carboxylesterase